MRGHVRERGPGAWELRAYAGRDALSGRKRYSTRTVRVKERREAEKALAAFVTELETSRVPAGAPSGSWSSDGSTPPSPAGRQRTR